MPRYQSYRAAPRAIESTTFGSVIKPRCVSVDFNEIAIILQLEDGRGITVPLEWLPAIKNASDSDRRNYQLVDGGEEIRWPELDQDLSVPALLGLPD